MAFGVELELTLLLPRGPISPQSNSRQREEIWISALGHVCSSVMGQWPQLTLGHLCSYLQTGVGALEGLILPLLSHGAMDIFLNISWLPPNGADHIYLAG